MIEVRLRIERKENKETSIVFISRTRADACFVFSFVYIDFVIVLVFELFFAHLLRETRLADSWTLVDYRFLTSQKRNVRVAMLFRSYRFTLAVDML